MAPVRMSVMPAPSRMACSAPVRGSSSRTTPIDRGVDGAAQNVEMAVRLPGRQVDARLDHRLATALRRQAGLDRRQDLLVVERELLDVEAIEKGDVDWRHRFPLQIRLPFTGARGAGGPAGFR
jgi:hypothetical protein